MDDRTLKRDARGMSLRDRRYCIRYPFAADAELLDMESGTKAEGVTSDISMGGAFICTSRPFASNARIRITLTRKDQRVEALGVVRIVKPRIGMGIEFIDLDSPYVEVLRRWVEQLGKTR
jgi:PilZ domain-containing protein